MPQIRLRPFMAADNGDFRPARQVRALPKCHAYRRNDDDAEMAIASAGEIMELNRRVETGGAVART
jgi:hypothetical protein